MFILLYVCIFLLDVVIAQDMNNQNPLHNILELVRYKGLPTKFRVE